MRPHKIAVIDDDASVRRSLQRLLQSARYEVRSWPSAREFMSECGGHGPACVILDVRMPGLNGLDLQAALQAQEYPPPIVFITGHGSIPMSVKAMQAGAVDFLPKPFTEQALLAAVDRALERFRQIQKAHHRLSRVQALLDHLTDREGDVYELIILGRLNKQIGFKLGISEKTVKVHRARVMEKLRARSVADLVRLAETPGLHRR